MDHGNKSIKQNRRHTGLLPDSRAEPSAQARVRLAGWPRGGAASPPGGERAGATRSAGAEGCAWSPAENRWGAAARVSGARLPPALTDSWSAGDAGTGPVRGVASLSPPDPVLALWSHRGKGARTACCSVTAPVQANRNKSKSPIQEHLPRPAREGARGFPALSRLPGLVAAQWALGKGPTRLVFRVAEGLPWINLCLRQAGQGAPLCPSVEETNHVTTP